MWSLLWVPAVIAMAVALSRPTSRYSGEWESTASYWDLF